MAFLTFFLQIPFRGFDGYGIALARIEAPTTAPNRANFKPFTLTDQIPRPSAKAIPLWTLFVGKPTLFPALPIMAILQGEVWMRTSKYLVAIL
jgi:hypothetical protein